MLTLQFNRDPLQSMRPLAPHQVSNPDRANGLNYGDLRVRLTDCVLHKHHRDEDGNVTVTDKPGYVYHHHPKAVLTKAEQADEKAYEAKRKLERRRIDMRNSVSQVDLKILEVILQGAFTLPPDVEFTETEKSIYRKE